MCRPLAVVLALALMPAPFAWAQSQSWATAPTETPTETPAPKAEAQQITDATILRLIEDGMVSFNSGDLETALVRFETANDMTFTVDTLSTAVNALPNLALARYYLKIFDLSEVSRFAASVATALDIDGFRDHPYRLEAMAFQGYAVYLDDRHNEADLILRAVVSATEGRDDLADLPDLAKAHELALFCLAAVTFQLESPDASTRRRAYLDADGVPDGWVSVEEAAFMYYVDIFARRGAGEDPGELAAEFSTFLDIIAALSESAPETMATFQGYLGLLQSEDGQDAAANQTFQKLHEYRLQNDMINDDFLFNIQRLAMTRRNLGDALGAYDFLNEMLEFGQSRGLESGVYSLFHEDMGLIQNALNNHLRAQEHFRRAYVMLRQSRQVNDPSMQRLRPLIDFADPGFADFPFAGELLAPNDVPLALMADGSTLLAEFFAGGYLVADERLWQVGEQQGTEDPLFRLNRALFLGLIGQQDGALIDLAAVRAAAPDMADNADIVELVAWIWGADLNPAGADDAIARLSARFDALTPPQQSAFLTMAVYQKFRQNEMDSARALAERWLAVDAIQIDRANPWHRLASAVMIEAGTVLFVPDQARRHWEQFERETRSLPALPVLADYGRVMYLSNAPDALAGPGVVVELSAILRRMEARLPAYHGLVSITQYALSNAFQWQDKTEEALMWLDRTTTSLRKHPFHNPDTVAFALSEQSRLFLSLGEVNKAALIAREAYEMIDPLSSQQDFVASIVTNFASALYQRTLDVQRVAELYARHLNDPVYSARIPPDQLARQLISYAEMLAEFGTWDETREALDRAEVLLTGEDGFDRRGLMSQLHFGRAMAEYKFDQGDYGFDRVRRSNDLFVELNDALVAQGGATGTTAESLMIRATWTALIGWEYAQTLPD